MSVSGRRRHSSAGSNFRSPSFAPFSEGSLRRLSSASQVANKVRHELTSFSLKYQDSPTSYPDSLQISACESSLVTPANNIGGILGYNAPNTQQLNTTRHISSNVSDWNEKVVWETRHTTQAQRSHPPRSAREGCEWVWFPEGFWAEREQLAAPQEANKRRKLRWFDRSSKYKGNIDEGNLAILPDGRLTSSHSFDVCTGRQNISGNRQRSGSQSSQSSKIIRGLQYMSPTYPHFKSPAGKPEGLYCRAKRVVTGSTTSHSPMDPSASRKLPNARVSNTTLLLKGTAQYLDNELHERRKQKRATPSLTPGFSPSPGLSFVTTGSRNRRIFGLAPWHRKSSRESFHSTTSSINNLLRGGTPAATPLTIDTTYKTNDGKIFSKVEISSPAAPNFLNSEASRIDTPQTSDEGSMKYHEYFASTAEAANDRIPTADGISPSTPPKESPLARSIGSFNRHHVNTFKLMIPEHLPTSPICPKSPKHSSGGTGVCPYHGRPHITGERKLVTGEVHVKRQSTLRTQQIRKDS